MDGQRKLMQSERGQQVLALVRSLSEVIISYDNFLVLVFDSADDIKTARLCLTLELFNEQGESIFHENMIKICNDGIEISSVSDKEIVLSIHDDIAQVCRSARVYYVIRDDLNNPYTVQNVKEIKRT